MDFRNRKPLIVASAERSNLSGSINGLRTASAIEWLVDSEIPFKEVEGVYKNTIEASFVIEPRNESEYHKIIAVFLDHYEQECVMLLDEWRNATLRYDLFGDRDESIGKLKSSTEFPWFVDAHTFCKKTGMYYTVE